MRQGLGVEQGGIKHGQDRGRENWERESVVWLEAFLEERKLEQEKLPGINEGKSS